MEMHDRLRAARQNAGYANATEAADALNVKQQTYLAHENGHRGFKPDSAEKYARRFSVSLEWLLTGKGAPASGEQQPAPSNLPDPSEGYWDHEAYQEAVQQIKDLKAMKGITHIPTKEYLEALSDFYDQAIEDRKRR